MIDVDYLIVGAGATGMAFADAILTETEATIALVDRYGRPGGHWNHAYPFVRLHQPSAFYGVNSRELGDARLDATGPNAGLYGLATGAEVLAYFDEVLHQQFLPTGRLHYFPMCEYTENSDVVSVVSGGAHEIRATKVVDATYSRVNVPSMGPPAFDVAPGLRCVAPNALPDLPYFPSSYVVIGAGKTGIDACLWLLATGVEPDAIRWVVPRDSWLLDRKNIQPVAAFFESTAGGFALQLEASAKATSIQDLFERLESSGQLLRLDPEVQPTMYRCATVTTAELDALRRIAGVVRMGRVRSIDGDAIVLDGGTIATSPDVVHVDCTADGLQRRPPVPVFDGDRIVLQGVRTCQQVFSAALIGHVEANFTDAARKNALCNVIPHPDSAVDWLRTAELNLKNLYRWSTDPTMASWLGDSRLNSVTFALGEQPTPEQLEIVGRVLEHMRGAVENLHRLLADQTGFTTALH